MILGVSRDGIRVQENFQAKQGFNVALLSDKEEAVCRLSDVITVKGHAQAVLEAAQALHAER